MADKRAGKWKEGTVRLFLTPTHHICTTVPENGLKTAFVFPCQLSASMIQSVQELTCSVKETVTFKFDYYLRNVFSTATYDLD